MKAIIYSTYGPPDVLRLEEIERPAPTDDEVSVRVHTASVNPLDWHYLRADPFFVRFMGAGLFKPKKQILGADIAGRVEAVGSNVSQFQPGDEVFGGCPLGGFAEFVCVAEKRIVPKPSALPFEDAAAVPVAALTALQALRDKAKVQPGQRVLVYGASGGVGTFAVQIAKSLGAEVTGVCSSRNLEMVRSIGADHVVDYTREGFTLRGLRYDVILAVAGDRSIFEYRRALEPNGRCVVIGGSSLRQMLGGLLLGPLLSPLGKKKVGAMMAKVNQPDLLTLTELLEARTIVPVIDRRYAFHEVPEALRYLERGHARGKVIIRVAAKV